ncbi:hypothetical protein U9M48_011168, partial [Paspalum notatum var. saurae]
ETDMYPSWFPVSSAFPVVLLILLPYVLQRTLCSSTQASPTQFNDRTDGDALLAIKASLSNQWSTMASWNTTTEFCTWQGVRCSIKHKHRVISLNLSLEGLAGTFSPSIGNLTFLRTLDLSGNNLQGEIPSSIGHLSRLRYIGLSNNLFHGEVNDNMKNCTSLESIYIDSNRFTGKIPSWLGGLSSLKSISMMKNNLSGTIPPSLANLSALQEMYFNFNLLEGSIPDDLGRLNNLEFLALAENHLSGTIPIALFNLSSLSHISLATNRLLHGMLPSDLGNRLRNLQYLLLGNNNFTGNIPASLVNATGIEDLDIGNNSFTGIVPQEIGKVCPRVLILAKNHLVATTTLDWKFMGFLTNCTRLQKFRIHENMFGGLLPNYVGNLSSEIKDLTLSYNEISGKIPFGIGNLVGLNLLSLSSNRLTGVLPESIGRLNSLEFLGVDENLLTGSMPFSLGNLTKLLNLFTDHNNFEGTLPASLGGLHEITAATFNDNKFNGSLPMEIFSLSSLSDLLNLSGNYLVGHLPAEVGGLTKLAYLDVSRNNFTGPLPDALSNCQSLIDLRMDSNSFSNRIPASFGQMRGLRLLNLTKNTLSGGIPQEIGLISGMEELYLSHNNLSGDIPETFENMTFMYKLDLSFNHLDGVVPTHGVFSNMSGLSLEGNFRLCGGIPELQLPPCNQKPMEHNKRKLHLILKVIVPIAGIILFFSLVLISISLRKKQRSQSETMSGFHLTDDRYPRVSYAELAQGTGDFDANNLLGTGRYGSVYRCNLLLKNEMTTVAVKVFDLQQPGSSKSFIAECQALNKIRHRNLISVITSCSSCDSRQNDFKALVFEFMPNGSLHGLLHQDAHASQTQQGLTLEQRLNIATDVADALDYLHSCDPPIVHCDLKPSNILLDQDLVAHVGDFGLAKIISVSESEQPSSNSKSSIAIRGTIGYVAPEYGQGGQVSPCGDVYSFGIVILELFTGMAPTHDMFGHGLTLQKHAENAFPGMLMNIVDPVLLSKQDDEEQNAMEDIEKVMFSIAKLALSCSKQTPAERMSTRDAAAEMHMIRDHHVKTRQQAEKSPDQDTLLHQGRVLYKGAHDTVNECAGSEVLNVNWSS